MLHSCMVHDQTIRVHKKELDLGESVEVYSDFFIDIIVEHVPEEADDFTLMKKIREQEKKQSTVDEFIIKPDKETPTSKTEKIPEPKARSTETLPPGQGALTTAKKEEFVINDEPIPGTPGDGSNRDSGLGADSDLGSPVDLIQGEPNLEEDEKARIDKVLELNDGSSSGEEGDTDESEEEEIDDYLENLEKNA